MNRLFLSMVMLFFTTATLFAQRPMKNTSTSGHAPVNGINMYYEIHGNGTIPLVLIHGGGSTIETTFGTLLPILAKHHKVIAVELQAHGRTSDRNAPESFEQDADDVAALLAYLHIAKANILGFSNGGTTTMQIAMRHPQLVNKIIVVSANYKREGMMPGFFDFMPNATLENMPQPLKEGFLKVTPDSTKLLVMFEKDKQRMINYKDIPDEMIKKINVPTLFIVGDHDVVTCEHVVSLSHLVANSQLVILPGTHGSFIGEACTFVKGSNMPQITASLLEEFLK